MRSYAIFLSALAFQSLASGTPIDEKRDLITGSSFTIAEHIRKVCWPRDIWGQPLPDAPCWQSAKIDYTCRNDLTFYSGDTNFAIEWKGGLANGRTYDGYQFLPEAQRGCFCQSQWWDRELGCQACYAAHGLYTGFNTADRALWKSVSSSYCAVTNTPTVGFDRMIKTAFPSSITALASLQTLGTLVDNLGTKTEVSNYWTDGLYDPRAYDVVAPTSTKILNTVYQQTVQTQTLGSASDQIVRTTTFVAPAAVQTKKTLTFNNEAGQIVQTVTPTLTPSFKPFGAQSSSNGVAIPAAVQTPIALMGALGAAAVAFL